MGSIEEKLRELGDPSGKQTSEYWNEWFQVVCGADHRAFEWYASVDEVKRVLQVLEGRNMENAAPEESNEAQDRTSLLSSRRKAPRGGRRRKMIHPGSGNSLLPIRLREDPLFTDYQHYVVDISNVALEEMKQIHDTHDRLEKEKALDDGASSPVTSPLRLNPSINPPSKSEATALRTVNPIQYILGDVLNPPLTFSTSEHDQEVDPDENSFDVWLDKGLIDALFKDSCLESLLQCKTLFNEANRLLRGSLKYGEADEGSGRYTSPAYMLIVTMGEDHSLQLILETWVEMIREGHTSAANSGNDDETNSYCTWSTSLTIHELIPISGTRRPFGVVIEKGTYPDEAVSSSRDCTEQNTDMRHQLALTVAWKYIASDDDGMTNAPQPDHSFDFKIDTRATRSDSSGWNEMIQHVQQLCHTSQKEYMERCRLKEERQKQQRRKSHRTLATIEIKPTSADIDLVSLQESIRNATWKTSGAAAFVHPVGETAVNDTKSQQELISVEWQPWTQSDSLSSEPSQESYYRIVPIGFGISKLVLRCIVDSFLLEALVDEIREWDPSRSTSTFLHEVLTTNQKINDDDSSDNGVAGVQSVDVVWEETFQIPDTPTLNFSIRNPI